MARKRHKLVTNQLRELIATCGISRYEIWKRTGISQPTLANFFSGKRGLSMEALDTLGKFFDLEIVAHRKQ